MSTYKPCGCKNTAPYPAVTPCGCAPVVPVTELKICDPPTSNVGCPATVNSDCVVLAAPTYSFVLTKEIIEINKIITIIQKEIQIIKETCCVSCTMVMSEITAS